MEHDAKLTKGFPVQSKIPFHLPIAATSLFHDHKGVGF